MKDLKSQVKEKIHQREMKISTYSAENDQIIVEGILIDNRLIDTFHLSGGKRPADTVHHLIIRMLVDKRLVIRQIETEMPETPHEECPKTMESLQELTGMKISRGFTTKVKDKFGNGRGCSHLSNLIVSMAPAAIQGFWTKVSSKPLPTDLKYKMKLLLADNCWVWRSDGTALKQLSE